MVRLNNYRSRWWLKLYFFKYIMKISKEPSFVIRFTDLLNVKWIKFNMIKKNLVILNELRLSRFNVRYKFFHFLGKENKSVLQNLDFVQKHCTFSKCLFNSLCINWTSIIIYCFNFLDKHSLNCRLSAVWILCNITMKSFGLYLWQIALKAIL